MDLWNFKKKKLIGNINFHLSLEFLTSPKLFKYVAGQKSSLQIVSNHRKWFQGKYMFDVYHRSSSTKISEFWFVTDNFVTDKINHDTDESRRHKLALYKPVPNNDFVIRGTLPNQSFYFLFSSLCYAEINSFVPYTPVLFHIRKPSILQFHVWCNGHCPSVTSCFSAFILIIVFFQFIYNYIFIILWLNSFNT